MKHTASERAKKATKHCRKKFACLGEGGKPLCEVGDCINNAIYFLKRLNETGCYNARSFGSEHHCTCPVRKELFDEHRT